LGYWFFNSLPTWNEWEKGLSMKAKVLSEQLDDVELWNREDASELERPTQPNKYGIIVASRDWTVETIVRQVEQENIDLDPAFQRRNAWRDHRRSRTHSTAVGLVCQLYYYQ
jgi:hypothetical protein